VFASLARFDIRFRWLIVAIWVVGVVAAVRALPALSSVMQSSNAQFLAASAPSVQAGALAAPFEGSNPSSTAVIVATAAPRLSPGLPAGTGVQLSVAQSDPVLIISSPQRPGDMAASGGGHAAGSGSLRRPVAGSRTGLSRQRAPPAAHSHRAAARVRLLPNGSRARFRA
jgi:hypothetical protein